MMELEIKKLSKEERERLRKEKDWKKFFDEDRHIRNREIYVGPLSKIYGKEINLSDFVSDAQLLVSLGIANYLRFDFFEDLFSVSEEPIPHNIDDLVKLVERCLDKEKEIVEKGSGSQVPILHVKVLDSYSLGAKLCACMESGIIDNDSAVQMLKRATRLLSEKALMKS